MWPPSLGGGGEVTAAQLAALQAQVDALLNTVVVADVTLGDTPSGGETDTTLTIQLYQRDGTTPITATRKVAILTSDPSSGPAFNYNSSNLGSDVAINDPDPVAGTIVANGPGIAVVETDATGLFSCTISNTTDEAVLFNVVSLANMPQDTVQTNACDVFHCATGSTTWSA